MFNWIVESDYLARCTRQAKPSKALAPLLGTEGVPKYLVIFWRKQLLCLQYCVCLCVSLREYCCVSLGKVKTDKLNYLIQHSPTVKVKLHPSVLQFLKFLGIVQKAHSSSTDRKSPSWLVESALEPPFHGRLSEELSSYMAFRTVQFKWRMTALYTERRLKSWSKAGLI